MMWALLEILVPLILALLLGLLIGWLLFRWRRRPLHAHEWNQLAHNARDAEQELGSVRAAYEEAKNERGVLSDRVASLTTDLDAAQIAVGATTQSNEALSGEVETQRTELEAVRAELEAAKEATISLEQDVHAAQTIIAGYVSLEGDNQDLRAEITSSDARIESLEHELTSVNTELTEKSNELSNATEHIDEVEGDSATTALVAGQIRDAETKAAELESALAAARAELDVSQGRIADLDTRLSTVSADLDAAHARVSELEGEIGGAQSQIAGFASLESDAGQLQIDLDLARERARDLEGQAAAASTYRTELDAAQGRLSSREAELAQARAELAAREQHERADEVAMATRTADSADSAESAEADGSEGDWHSDETTTLGTAGARHIDDLKVIRGIGPRMEELLNSFGITSWEQLAELDESDVTAVDDALQEFPGRIERDGWVAQANELVREFPDRTNRPTRKTYRNRSNDENPFS